MTKITVTYEQALKTMTVSRIFDAWIESTHASEVLQNAVASEWEKDNVRLLIDKNKYNEILASRS